MPNRLASETSPYLLQHKDNPVDWYPWGDEAFSVASDSDRPILLSVGYSTCHWCHVMAHESFEDSTTADLINEHFVPIKVDREERPDVDSIYMDAVTAMTGRGGWPMTVFLTPDAKPFYAGTYFPPDDRHGMPSFRRVLGAIHDAWTNSRSDIAQQASALTDSIGRRIAPAEDVPSGSDVADAYHTLVRQYDAEYGGLGGAPKFPQAPVLEFLIRIQDSTWADRAREMLTTTLSKMAAGGIYDHVGGGFSRYAVDRMWLVPHFEKMLYDNADLARLYARAWQITGDAKYRQTATETLDYILRDLTDPAGGFYAGEDADSEGVEGKFYVFGQAEFADVVGSEDGSIAAAYFGVTEPGNFEGSNILHEARSSESVASEFDRTVEEVDEAIVRAKARLSAHRALRIRPGLDTKVITAWNGLALRAFAVAGSVFGEARYLEVARRNAQFVLSSMVRAEGRLYRTWSDGTATIRGFLEDHASYALGLLELFQATGEAEWFREARNLVDGLGDQFGGPEGVVYSSAADSSHLIVRPSDQQDNPTASGASLAAECYLLMSMFTGDHDYRIEYERIVKASAPLIGHAPSAVGHLLALSATGRLGLREIALTGPDALGWANKLTSAYRPAVVVAAAREPAEDIPLLAERFRENGTWGYVCTDMVCEAPVDSYEALISLL